MGDIGGRQGLKCSIRIKPKTTPLGTDKTIIKEWLTSQPDVLQLQRKSTFEDIKGMLYTFLNPEAEEETTPTPTATNVTVEEDLPLEKEASPSANMTTKGKVSKVDKFDAMFDDDNDSPF